MNRRRKLVFTLGASVLAAPFAALGQAQGKLWRIGFLWDLDPSYYTDRLTAFIAGMRELGYVEGRTYSTEHRSAQSERGRLPSLAAELVALKVDLILTNATPPAVAARNATSEIPILIVNAGDPVGSGLAESLRRPGGNVTGLTSMNFELYSKRIDLLRQLLPDMRRVGFLFDSTSSADLRSAGRFESDSAKLGLKAVRAPVHGIEEIEAVFAALKRNQVQGLIVSTASASILWRERIIEIAAKNRIPAIYARSTFSEAGGLISFGVNYHDLWRRAAAYADKIFKGAKPGELPIEQPTKFEMVVNMKTAKALGLKVPNSILVQATRVIE
jgi:putative ABC transport system substrate-binding protein